MLHRIAAAGSALLLISFTPFGVQAQPPAGVGEEVEEILIIGTRRPGRSAGQSIAPVDVITGEDFSSTGNSADITDNLRLNVPSYNASTASGDGDTFSRPTSLRGLAPDQILVMVNGKRRHRAAVISEFVPSAGKGAHGPNIGMIPEIALERVEVLRDGASAQYGSDAIAGVMNFITRNDDEGGEVRIHYGQFFEGEQSYSVAGNFGMRLTASGFLNLSVEHAANEALSRGVQRPNAQALINAGVRGVGQDTPFHDAPLVQTWGRAEGENLRTFLNAGIDVGDDDALYAQANYADTFGRYRFFFRDLNHITLRTLREEYGYDGLPAGFTPFFDGSQIDTSFVAGIRGSWDNGMNYDLSAGYGFNELDFLLSNTINQSLGLGPDGNPPQRNFDVGAWEQKEVSLNADITRELSDTLHLAFGAEWREETFTIVPGEPSSYFSAGSSGFKGFDPASAGDFSRANYALYAEIEQDVSSSLVVQYAGRYEDFSDFGDTLNGKLAARFDLNQDFALRGALSTGFHAPTPGQANIQKITTTFDNDLGLQVESGTVPPTHPLALAAGGSPLTEEKSTNLSLGFVAGFGGDIALTADLYRIDIEGRIFKTQNLPTIDPATGVGSNVQFFTNALGLEVSGLDLVMTSSFNWAASGAVTDLNLAYNRNMVDVVKQRAVNGILPVSEASVEDIEESYPRDRLTLSAGTSADAGWTLLLRLNYLGSHYDERGRINGVDGGPPTRKISSTIFFDAEFGYELYDGLTLVLGAVNLLDEYADWIGPPWANRLDVGLPFGRRTAANYEGGSWYARLNYVF